MSNYLEALMNLSMYLQRKEDFEQFNMLLGLMNKPKEECPIFTSKELLMKLEYKQNPYTFNLSL